MRLAHDIAGKIFEGSGHEPERDAPDATPFWEVPRATAAEVDHAVTSAKKAFRTWRMSTLEQRAAILVDAAGRMIRERHDLAELLTRETGRALAQAEQEVIGAARILRQYARLDPVGQGRVLTNSSSRVWGMELREPAGVAGLITTWNVPLQLAAHKLGAALMAGCTAVAKPSPLAPNSMLRLVRALRAAGLPQDAVSVVQGDRETGTHLVEHPDIGVVSFTGGSSAGKEVMACAAASPKKVVLELGGKSANIVFDDAPLDRAARGIVAGFIRNQGATCTSATRVFVHQKVYEQVVELVAKNLEQVRVGDPYMADTQMGAIRTARLCEAMDSAVQHTRECGGVVQGSGDAVVVPGRSGYYRRPAVLMEVPPDSYLHRTELMAPIATMLSFSHDEDAVAAANDSNYGLAAGVWTSDMERAEWTWSELDVGTVYVNSYHRIDAIPLASGGRKLSGIGAEGGSSGILEFLSTKSIHIPRR